LKNNSLKHLAVLNLATVIITSAALLGKYMSLYPPFVIWSRSFIAAVTLGLIFSIKNGISFRLPFKDIKLVISGVLLCVHWVLFFYSIHFSTVAVAAVSVFTYPIFTAMLEPFILKSKMQTRHIVIGFMLLVGIYIISPQISLEDDIFLGLLCGLGSAFAYALRNILSKSLIERYDGWQIMFYQVLITALLLSPFMTYHSREVVIDNIIPLIALGVIPTVIGHGLVVKSLKYFTTSKASILMGMQPVYTILLGVILLGESPSLKIYLGGSIIMGAVFFELIKGRDLK
jgi:drug/metabolite transporter (DMT)-like permease